MTSLEQSDASIQVSGHMTSLEQSKAKYLGHVKWGALYWPIICPENGTMAIL